MKKIEYLTNTEKQINEIAQRALRKVDGCAYLILAHGDDKREFAVRCAEIPLTYVLLESGSILSDKKSILSIKKHNGRLINFWHIRKSNSNLTCCNAFLVQDKNNGTQDKGQQ